MFDSDKRDPEKQKNQPTDNNEPIIDLVEEVGEAAGGPDLMDLEKNLLELERKIGISLGEDPQTDGEAAYELPEIPDIDAIDLDDASEGPMVPEPGSPAMTESDAQAAENRDIDWLFQELDGSGPAGPGKDTGADPGAITEITEFDEQFLEAEEIDEDPLMLAEDEPAEEEEEDDAELLDLEEDEADNEIVWLDDIAAEAAGDAEDLAEMPETPTGLEQAEPEPPLFGQEAESLVREAPEPPRPEFSPLAAAAVAPLLSPVGSSPAEEAAADDLFGEAPISSEQIDAAVERIIERKFAGRIEAVIVQAIEKTVTREIEKLKRLLLENDPENDTH